MSYDMHPDRLTEALAAATPDDGLSLAPEDYLGTPLSAGQARTALIALGYRSEAHITQAIEHAPWVKPGDASSFLAYHTVHAEDGALIISRAPVQDPLLAWRGHGGEIEGDVETLLRLIEAGDQWLDEDAPEIYRTNPLANHWRRIAAGPASEGQESVDALNLATGGNPRKGVQGDFTTIMAELGDTAFAALLAIQSFTKNTEQTWAVFLAAAAKVAGRTPERYGLR